MMQGGCCVSAIQSEFKAFSEEKHGRTGYENTERSSKGHEDHSSARLEVRLFQGAMEVDTSLMAASYPADIPWLTAP